MNKTIITSIAIICASIIYISCYVINSNERIRITLKTETRDRFTVCMQTVMSEARQGGKPIDATEAKGICSSVEKT